MTAPLADIRVLDLSAQLPGPYASMLLSDMGARVIKVERIDGDPARQLAPIFVGVNRGKESIAIDLKAPHGVEIVHRIARSSDVVLEGFRPGVAQRLGVGHAALATVNPRLVYCSISGFGQSGPYRDRAGHDANYMAAAGAIDPENPRLEALPIADLASGMFAALSIVSALRQVERTGVGTYIDIAMTDAVLSWMATRVNPERMPARGRDLASLVPCYGLFETKDGRHLSLAIAHEDHFWKRFCEHAGLADIANLDAVARIANGDAIEARLRSLFLEKTLADWLALLPSSELPIAPVATIDEVRRDPHHRARGSIYSRDGTWFTASPWPLGAHATRSPPALGEHTRAILDEVGFDAAAIDALLRAGVVVEATAAQ